MRFFRQLTDNKRGVALFIVLTSMATLAIFLGEITYTAQINQKLAYDRLDSVKATALAKSGFRLALLRIRAYTEIQKLIKSAGSAADAVVPKEMLQKIWNEPIIIPFTGDISMLPNSVKDAVEKFRKESGMEGKLYITLQSQSNKFNLNSYIAPFAPPPSPTPSPSPGEPLKKGPEFSSEEARNLLADQISETMKKKFEEDEPFRETYRNLKVADLADDIMAWNDLTYDSMRAQSAPLPYKRAPFYDISELHYLPNVDDGIYDVLAPAYSTGVDSSINVNKIQMVALKTLIPSMTEEERKKFFEFRDRTGGTTDAEKKNDQANNGAKKDEEEGGPFKSVDDFHQWIGKNVASFNSATTQQEFKDNLVKRGITITVDESQFLVHIEATVNQTKRTLEAIVTTVQDQKATNLQNPNTPPNQNNRANPNPEEASKKRSSLKVVQMRFL
jgi:type II secretory pathway component PulK